MSSSRPQHSDEQRDNGPAKPNLLQTISSILAALFGVQSAKNRERDFTKGDAGNFIGVYVVLVVVFVVAMMLVVRAVLSSAGV